MIDWEAVRNVELNAKELMVTLRTKEGYPLARSTYNSFAEAMASASKATRLMLEAKRKKDGN
jgi:hypothetical protein